MDQKNNISLLGEVNVKRLSLEEKQNKVNEIVSSNFDFSKKKINNSDVFENFDENLDNFNVEDLNVMISNIVKLCNNNKLNEAGLFKRIFSKARNKIQEYQVHFNSVQEHLKILVDEIDKKQLMLDENFKSLNRILNSEVEKYYEIIDELEIYESAKKILLENNELSEKDEIESIFKSTGVEYKVDLIDLNIDNLNKWKIQKKQFCQQILLSINNYKKTKVALAMMEEGTVDLWRNSIRLYVNNLKNKDCIDFANTVMNATDNMWKNSSIFNSQNSVEIQELSNRSFLSFNSIKDVNDSIIKTMEKIKELNKENKVRRISEKLSLEKEATKINNILNHVHVDKKYLEAEDINN